MFYSLFVLAFFTILVYYLSNHVKLPTVKKIDFLANHPQHLPTVAKWLFDEWGDPANEQWIENAIKSIGKVMSNDSLPVHLLALENDVPVGFIALKFREMPEYPEREHWLGSLYVIHEARGRGIGSALIKEVLKYAEHYNIPKLSLQTEWLDGGVYKSFGWKPVEIVSPPSHGLKVLVMERSMGG